MVTYGQVGELVLEEEGVVQSRSGSGSWSRVSSAAVILASIGPPSLAALLLLKKLTDVFWGHNLHGSNAEGM